MANSQVLCHSLHRRSSRVRSRGQIHPQHPFRVVTVAWVGLGMVNIKYSNLFVLSSAFSFNSKVHRLWRESCCCGAIHDRDGAGSLGHPEGNSQLGDRLMLLRQHNSHHRTQPGLWRHLQQWYVLSGIDSPPGFDSQSPFQIQKAPCGGQLFNVRSRSSSA